VANQTRQDAFDLMIQHASELGANAIVGVRYDATEIMNGVTEVLAYGTLGRGGGTGSPNEESPSPNPTAPERFSADLAGPTRPSRTAPPWRAPSATAHGRGRRRPGFW